MLPRQHAGMRQSRTPPLHPNAAIHPSPLPSAPPNFLQQELPKGLVQSPSPNLLLLRFPQGSGKATAAQCCTRLVWLHLPFPLPSLGRYDRLLQLVFSACRLIKPMVKEKDPYLTPLQSSLLCLKGFGKTFTLVNMRLTPLRESHSGANHPLR